MVVITDVSSITGTHLARELLSKKQQVRGIDDARTNIAQLISEGLDGVQGDITDPVFLTSCFRNVDSVFFIIPLRANKNDYRRYFVDAANAMTNAAHDSKIKSIFLFSSMGADEKEEAGLLSGYGDVEEILDTLDIKNLTVFRPGYFMDHLLPKISMIRTKDIIGDVINPDIPIYFTDLKDAAVQMASVYLNNQFFGRSKIEMYSDKKTLREATKIIGNRIDIPELPCVQFSDMDYRNYLIEKGASISFANLYVETAHAIGRGVMSPSLIDSNTPNLPTRLSNFVEKVFVPAYHSGEE